MNEHQKYCRAWARYWALILGLGFMTTIVCTMAGVVIPMRTLYMMGLFTIASGALMVSVVASEEYERWSSLKEQDEQDEHRK